MKFTSEDLLNAMGLKLGQVVELEYPSKFISYKIIKTHDIFIRLQNIKDVTNTLHIDTLLDRDYTIIQPKPTLTEDEKVILRNVDKRYKYIAKDNYEEKGMENDLVLFAQEPVKNDYWFEVSVENTDYVYFSGYLHLFQFIKPMECYSIEELLKE